MPGANFQPYEKYVQQGMVDGQYASGAFTMVAAGPPRLANIGGSAALAASQGAKIVQPIGILQSFSLGESAQWSRIFEIGSERSYFIRGRTMGQISLGRILYHGPSMLRMLYSYYQDLIPPTLVQPVFANIGLANMSNPHDVKVPPGYENLYLNLASDLFGQPVGLMLKMIDSNEDTIGAIYFEGCTIPNYSFSTDANGLVIQESCGVQYERSVPVAVSALALIQDVAAGILA